jgi:septal ring factor EnvC (AmiA/AmiB activator)
MSLIDLQALAPVRKHREGQAERALRQQRDLLALRETAMAQAKVRLSELRERQADQREALTREYQGKAMTLRALGAWTEQEHRLMADLALHERSLQDLSDARALQAQETHSAERHLQGRRRDMEKLKVLTDLLSKECTDE